MEVLMETLGGFNGELDFVMKILNFLLVFFLFLFTVGVGKVVFEA